MCKPGRGAANSFGSETKSKQSHVRQKIKSQSWQDELERSLREEIPEVLELVGALGRAAQRFDRFGLWIEVSGWRAVCGMLRYVAASFWESMGSWQGPASNMHRLNHSSTLSDEDALGLPRQACDTFLDQYDKTSSGRSKASLETASGRSGMLRRVKHLGATFEVQSRGIASTCIAFCALHVASPELRGFSPTLSHRVS